jgi:hypothetical protein
MFEITLKTDPNADDKEYIKIYEDQVGKQLGYDFTMLVSNEDRSTTIWLSPDLVRNLIASLTIVKDLIWKE